jgi:hypothetical protein
VSDIGITQDHEVDDDGEVGGPLAVFWAPGHGHDSGDFVRAVIEHCLDEGIDVPAIPADVEPVGLWQRLVPRQDCVEYQRTDFEPLYDPANPITVLDLDSRGRGGTKCGVDECREPWSSGRPVRVSIEPSPGDASVNSPYMAVRIWLCREHASRFPDPSYRVFMVPVGATILLPSAAAEAST